MLLPPDHQMVRAADMGHKTILTISVPDDTIADDNQVDNDNDWEVYCDDADADLVKDGILA